VDEVSPRLGPAEAVSNADPQRIAGRDDLSKAS
jgi:hypothetical protein